MNRTRAQTAGFTILEILIGLAIGSLILVVIILAIHGGEQRQRDAARKANVDGLVAAINEYATSHGNVFPVCNPPTGTNCQPYLPGGWTWTEPMSGVASNGPAWSWIMWDPGTPSYSQNAPCEKPVNPDPNPSGYVTTPLAAGGYYCVLY